jgi:hypothetical protein
MTEQLLDDPSQFPPVMVPSGSDPRTPASLLTGFQALANRTANLLSRLTNVTRLREGQLADMLAVAVGAANDGESFVVLRQGMYVYEFGATDPVRAPWIYAPSASPGRWIHVLATLVNAKGGLASTNRTVSVQTFALDGASAVIFRTSSSSFVDAAPVAVTLPACVPGDLLLIDCVPAFGLDGAALLMTSTYAVGKLVAVDGGNEVDVPGTLLSGATDSSYATAYRIAASYTVANAGDVVVKAKLRVSDPTYAAVWAKPTSLRVVQLRP